MDCKDFTHDLMLDYGDRLLDTKTRERADEHLGACRACRDRLEEIRKIAGAVRRTLVVPAHKALTDQLEASVLGQFGKFQADRRRTVSRHRAYWAGAVALAAAVLIAVIIGTTWKESGARQPQPNEVVKVNPEPPVTPEEPKPAPPNNPVPTPPRKVEPPVPVNVEEPLPSENESPKPEPTPTPEPKPKPAPRPEPPREVASPVSPLPLRGDFNRNGRLDYQDATLLDQELLAGRTHDSASADLNRDGRVDCGDVLAILQVAEQNP